MYVISQFFYFFYFLCFNFFVRNVWIRKDFFRFFSFTLSLSLSFFDVCFIVSHQQDGHFDDNRNLLKKIIRKDFFCFFFKPLVFVSLFCATKPNSNRFELTKISDWTFVSLLSINLKLKKKKKRKFFFCIFSFFNLICLI